MTSALKEGVQALPDLPRLLLRLKDADKLRREFPKNPRFEKDYRQLVADYHRYKEHAKNS